MIIPTVSPASNVIYDYAAKPDYPLEDYEDDRISSADVFDISNPPKPHGNRSAIALASVIFILTAILLVAFIRKYFKKTNPRASYQPVAQADSSDAQSSSETSITIEPPLPPVTPASEGKALPTSASDSGASSDDYLPSTLTTIPSNPPALPPLRPPIGVRNEADGSPPPSRVSNPLPPPSDQIFIESGWPPRPAMAEPQSLPVLRWDPWQSSPEPWRSTTTESMAAEDSTPPTEAEGSDSQSSEEDFHSPPMSPSFFILPARITPPGSRHQSDSFLTRCLDANIPVVKYEDVPDEVPA